MPQIVETEVFKPGFPDRLKPPGIANTPPDGLAAIRKTKARMLADLTFQNSDRILIQRDTSRRAILGMV